jgi:exodeoxyribonuclease VII large subunit
LAPGRLLRQAEADIGRLAERFVERTPAMLTDQLRRLESIESRVALLDPANLLRRGWSITRDANGNVIRSVDQVESGDLVTTRVADGTLTSRIEDA